MKTCLIVTGDAEQSSDLREIVEDLGFIVHEASNSEGALLATHALLPDAILVDGTIADMETPGLMSKFMKLKNGKNPLVLLCSSSEKLEAVPLAMRFYQEGLLSEQHRVAFNLEKLENSAEGGLDAWNYAW